MEAPQLSKEQAEEAIVKIIAVLEDGANKAKLLAIVDQPDAGGAAADDDDDEADAGGAGNHRQSLREIPGNRVVAG